MTALKEYLGTIVSEIASARAAADMHTMEIAKFFSEDENLSKFTVPKFRFSNIELDIPYIVEAVTPATSTPSTKHVKHNSPKKITAKILSASTQFAETHLEYNLSDYQKNRLARKVQVVAKSSYDERNEMTTQLSNQYSLKVTQEVINSLLSIKKIQKCLNDEQAKSRFVQLDKEIKSIWNTSVEIEVRPGKTEPGSIRVLADHGSLKDNATDINVARIKMTLHEDGLENKNTLGIDGEVTQRLVKSD